MAATTVASSSQHVEPVPAERPHPLTPLIKGWISLVAIVVFMGRDFVDHPREALASTSTWRWVLFVVLAVILVGQMILGLFVARTTRFVVDDRELRVERNFIQHTSDRIPFSKIQAVDISQPFAARIFGLAAIRIDVGSGSGKNIEYLTRKRAYDMRAYLMARAHGDTITVEQSATEVVDDAWNDLGSTDEVVVQASPRYLVISAVLSVGFWVLLTPLVVLVVGAIASGHSAVGLGGSLSTLLALGGYISNRVVKDWSFRLVRARKGLRISRGITTLSSESLPVDRIQGIAVQQDLLWRPFGIYRARIAVLGHRSDNEGENSQTGHVIVPAGTKGDVDAAIDAIWPGFRLDDLAWQQPSPRGKWLCWWRLNRHTWAMTPGVAALRGGLINDHIALVPHARVQSVALKQGPAHRALGLAIVQVHICGSEVPWTARYLDAPVARGLVLSEMDRMREARSEQRRLRAIAALPAPEASSASGGSDPMVTTTP